MDESLARPSKEQVLDAIETYLAHAYAGAAPAAVQQRVEALRRQAPQRLYDCPCFESEAQSEQNRISLRLGNRLYPHMKLTIDPRPDGRGYLFRADTHDRHIDISEDSPEYATLRQMREQNQQIAQDIERAWTQRGLPTFKSYLREDLARRKG